MSKARLQLDLMSSRDIQAEYGLSATAADSIIRALAREGLVHRFRGVRTRYVPRAEVARRLQRLDPNQGWVDVAAPESRA